MFTTPIQYEYFDKKLSFTLVPLTNALIVAIKIFKLSTIKTLKLPKLLRKLFGYVRFLTYYVKTFFKYSLFTFPIYILRREYDYVDHAESSWPEKYNTGFSFWWSYHKDELLEYFKPRDIDSGYNLYVDFISREEYLESQSFSRDYAMEAFENGHPSTINHGGY